MKTSRYSDSQIMAIPKQAEAGIPVPGFCREYGIGNSTFYKWRAKYGGMDAPMVAWLKALEAENRQLKKMYAEGRIKAELRKEALEKKVVKPWAWRALVQQAATAGKTKSLGGTCNHQ